MKRFIFLLLLLGCLDAYSQKAAIRVNALSAIDGAFGPRNLWKGNLRLNSVKRWRNAEKDSLERCW